MTSCVAVWGTLLMDIEDLRTFVEVADAGGVSPAALRLGVSKSILLARSTRGASLTEAGATFRDHAARVSAEIDAARETITPAGDLRGRLRISAPLTFGPTHFAPVLAEMAKRHPRLQIQTCYSDRFVDLIAEGFDCGIRVGYLQDSNMVARRIGPVYGKFLASPAYIAEHGAPRRPQDLMDHEALMQGVEVWQATDGDRIISLRPQGRFKADNGIALIAAAKAGLGVAYLPDWLTRDDVRAGSLVEVLADYPPPPAGAYVIRPPGQHPNRKISVLTDLLIECFDSASGAS
ncbi:hypothetical protein LTR94_024455 [Friedmanniomyces endolithicus]|nr:hypothetical protein LTR94_024455 [Friedmanniomyces endolithicus]